MSKLHMKRVDRGVYETFDGLFRVERQAEKMPKVSDSGRHSNGWVVTWWLMEKSESGAWLTDNGYDPVYDNLSTAKEAIIQIRAGRETEAKRESAVPNHQAEDTFEQEVQAVLDKLALPASYHDVAAELLGTYPIEQIEAEHVDAMVEVFQEQGIEVG